MKYLFTFLLPAILFLAACNSSGTSASESPEQPALASNLVTMEIGINGMTCEGCEMTIKKGLEGLNGISSVKASHLDSTAIVELDTSLVSLDMISAEVDTLGYTYTGLITIK